MLDVGFTAILNNMSPPLVMPPLIPPAWLVNVCPAASESLSLCTDPLCEAEAKPSPNSTPRTAGMEEQMRQTALHRIEERFAPSDRDTRGPALHYTSYRIALFSARSITTGKKTTFALTAYLRNLCGYGLPHRSRASFWLQRPQPPARELYVQRSDRHRDSRYARRI